MRWSETQESSPTRSATARRVLVVDDEPMMGATLRVALADEHEVSVVASGTGARELLATDPNFDVIVCDLMMPSFSGMDLYAWLQSHRPTLASRMIFMTGGAYTPAAQGFLHRVENPYIQKPFDMDDLIELVERTATS